MKKVLIFLMLGIFVSPIFASSLDSEVDKYWGERRKIKVIQKKEFTKKSKIEATIYGGIVPNDAFYNSVPMGIKVDYFLSEFLSANLAASYNLIFDSSTVSTLTKLGVNVDFIERANWQVLLGMDYSFLYGKAAFGTTTLSYFDMYTSFMLGVFGTSYYDKANPTEEQTGIDFGAGVGLGIRFYLTKSISFRLEGRQEFFLRTSTSNGGQGGVQKPLELVVGIGWLF